MKDKICKLTSKSRVTLDQSRSSCTDHTEAHRARWYWSILEMEWNEEREKKNMEEGGGEKLRPIKRKLRCPTLCTTPRAYDTKLKKTI